MSGAEDILVIVLPEYAPADCGPGELDASGNVYTFPMIWKPTGRIIRYEVPRGILAGLRAELAERLEREGDAAWPETRMLKEALDKEPDPAPYDKPDWRCQKCGKIVVLGDCEDHPGAAVISDPLP